MSIWIRSSLIYCTSMIVVISISLFSAPASWSYSIIIDAGHGGVDQGAVRWFNKKNIKEAEVVLSVAHKVQTLLNEVNTSQNKNWSILQTRNKNITVNLGDRVKFAKKNACDLFVSLHANTASNQIAKGLEFYFNQYDHTKHSPSLIENITSDIGRTGKTYKSLKLGQLLRNQFPDTPSVIRRANFTVLERTPCPAVLFEIGFLSHPKEIQELISDQRQSEIAQAVTNSIVKYIAQNSEIDIQ